MFRKLGFSALTLVATVLFTNVILAAPAVRPERAVHISGPIMQGNILKLIGPMNALAKDGSGLPIDLIINSPGGEVITGYRFINMMEAVKATGTKIRCFVPEVAASMAFQILTRCDERYALSRSFLLWHRVRVVLGGFMGTVVTAPVANSLARDLQAVDDLILSECRKALGKDMDDRDIVYHFEQETLHIGENLHKLAPSFITTYPHIPGLLEAMGSPDVPKNNQEDTKKLLRPGTIVYQYDLR